MNNDALNNIKKLRDVLNEAIAAMIAGREVRVDEKRPSEDVWHNVAFRDRKYRCVIKPREVWINEYPRNVATMWRTREEADERATQDRIRCIRFVEALDNEP